MWWNFSFYCIDFLCFSHLSLSRSRLHWKKIFSSFFFCFRWRFADEAHHLMRVACGNFSDTCPSDSSESIGRRKLIKNVPQTAHLFRLFEMVYLFLLFCPWSRLTFTDGFLHYLLGNCWSVEVKTWVTVTSVECWVSWDPRFQVIRNRTDRRVGFSVSTRRWYLYLEMIKCSPFINATNLVLNCLGLRLTHRLSLLLLLKVDFFLSNHAHTYLQLFLLTTQQPFNVLCLFLCHE